MRSILLAITLSAFSSNINGQGSTYELAKRTGDAGLEELVAIVKEQYTSDSTIAEFFYYWTACHIDYDRAKASSRQPYYYDRENLIDLTFKERRAVCSGYAELYCEFLTRCGIACEVIPGVSKTRENILQDVPYSEDHSWNAVRINGRWRLVDVTWANTTSRDGIIDDYYFMTEPGWFILDHFPSDPRWQLLSDYITLDEFQQYPCYTKKYFQLGFGDYTGKALQKARNGSFQLRLGVSDGWEPVPVLVDKNDRKNNSLKYDILPGTSTNYQTLIFSTRKDILRIDAVKREKNFIITEFGIAYYDLEH